jgi:hypothetical protein
MYRSSHWSEKEQHLRLPCRYRSYPDPETSKIQESLTNLIRAITIVSALFKKLIRATFVKKVTHGGTENNPIRSLDPVRPSEKIRQAKY